MRKKLAILIYSMASGGAEKVISILLREFKSYEITLVLMNDKIDYTLPDGLNICYLENSNPLENGFKKLLKLFYLGLTYKNFCKNNNIEISLSFMNRPNYINIVSRFFGNKSKIILSERAMPSLQHKSGLQGFINRLLIRKLYPYADKIIANSKGNCTDLINNFGIRNIEIINNPIDIEEIKKLKDEEVTNNLRKFTFITVGRLDRGKNHELMINAFFSLKNRNTQLFIIGDGELKNKLQNQIKTLKLEEQVFLLGKKKNPYKYLSKADCFLFSSNHEGFPNVILEALACNLPIISTDCESGPREILSSNNKIIKTLSIDTCEYGVLVPVNDANNFRKAMDLLYHDNNLRSRYVKASTNRSNYFCSKIVVTQYERLLSE